MEPFLRNSVYLHTASKDDVHLQKTPAGEILNAASGVFWFAKKFLEGCRNGIDEEEWDDNNEQGSGRVGI